MTVEDEKEIQAKDAQSGEQQSDVATMCEEVVEEKRKLTKEEKKAKYSGQQHEEPMKTWRTLFKELKAPNEKVVRSLEEKEEADELATSALHEIFGNSSNPYRDGLELFALFPDGKENYRRLTEFILVTMKAWIEKCIDGKKKETFLADDIRKDALKKMSEKGTTHMRLMGEIFDLTRGDLLDTVIERIEDLSDRNKFKEAMEVANLFDLHEQFPIEKFIIPNVLQDRQQQVLEFIGGRQRLLREYIKFLDSMVGLTEREVREYLSPYEKIMSVNINRFIDKPLEKSIRKLLKDLGIPESMAENTDRVRQQNAIRYSICNRDQSGGELTPKLFDEIKQPCSQKSDLQKYVIEQCFFKGREKEALMWAYYFKVDHRRLPGRLSRIMLDNPIGTKEEAMEMIERYGTRECPSTYILSNGTPIEWISTWNDVQRMINEIHNDPDQLIGIDSEFKPVTSTSRQEIALLQVSTFAKVYLVDFISMEMILSEDQLIEMSMGLFGFNHYKLGFDMQSDINALTTTLPFVSQKVNDEKTHVICLKRLVNELLDENEELIDFSECTSEKDRAKKRAANGDESSFVHMEGTSRAFKLSDLVEVILKTSLDKSEQVSNWAIRPLRHEQIVYAARDANILLDLYSELRRIAEEGGMNFDEIIERIDNELDEKRKDKLKKKKAKLTDEEYAELVETVNNQVLERVGKVELPKAFITDAMFSGLGKHLRRLGVDVLFTESKDELIRIGRQFSDRIILSFGKSMEQLIQIFPKRVFSVNSTWPPKEQVKHVLIKFDIHLSPSDVFTRCMLCNGDQFVIVPSVVIQAMYDSASKVDDFEDECFEPKMWIERIKSAKSEDHGGFTCKLVNEDEERIMVQCHNGVIDISRVIVIADSIGEAVEVQVLRVQSEVIDSARPFYYICAKCGKVYWDGTHGKRYDEFAKDVLNLTNSTSNDSLQ